MIVKTFTNNDDCVTSIISTNESGLFNVSLRDDDSGETVTAHTIKIKTIDEAIKIAMKYANIKEESNA